MPMRRHSMLAIYEIVRNYLAVDSSIMALDGPWRVIVRWPPPD
ncbi:hypothetical protein SAMN05444506_12133 [Pseudomonas syringae]|uniref:Uncharacterized protein n=3 Tax=Pseudomonas syringae group TaxID=136849 RepID=A0AAV1BJV2_PSEUB|nr:hypothetical protein PSTA9_04242 [Pseudomonas syringae pv. tomato]SDZ47677.1 hypothetical protein SAMN05444506_12133 [Pseudomonas syringae]SOQ09298.1 hypothetical protein NCPPB2254_02269 [Pseudomonas syringae pv. persicae]SOS26786.1 hypothetical protein CFBP3846_02367 [Pseudomonas syringae pv. avii]KUR51837.1 hypothetical protein PST407_00041 [Pseudomonas syringae pv. tomato]